MDRGTGKSSRVDAEIRFFQPGDLPRVQALDAIVQAYHPENQAEKEKTPMTEPTLDEFLAAYPPEIRALALEARSLILRVIPDAVEMVDPPSKIVAYGLGRKYADLICAIQPYQKYLNLIFSKGTQLPDPDQRLTGTGKRARHIKIEALADLSAPSTQTLIEEALRISRL